TFYSLSFDPAPVFLDPPSNDWFGFQAWSMERVAEYYYATGDEKAKVILDRWIPWARANTKLTKDSFAIPSNLKWTGQPQKDWNPSSQNFDPKDKGFNSTLHVAVTDSGPDLGVGAALAQTFMFYAKKSGDKETQKVAKELLDRMWAKYRGE